MSRPLAIAKLNVNFRYTSHLNMYWLIVPRNWYAASLNQNLMKVSLLKGK